MKITTEMLSRYKKPCEHMVLWFNAQESHDLVQLVEDAIVGGDDMMGNANWVIVTVMTKPQAVRYACFAARQVLKIFMDTYPEDNRPLAAIEAAEAWVAMPTAENAGVARSAARAASEACVTWAARADKATVSAASSAAWAASAANVACVTWAARAASEASAAWAASVDWSSWADRAAGKEGLRTMEKILRHGVEILKEKKYD